MQRWLALSVGLLLASSALAQQAGPAAYSLSLSPQAVITVSKGIMKMPYEDAAPVLQDIQKQLQEQVDAWNKAHPPAGEEKK